MGKAQELEMAPSLTEATEGAGPVVVKKWVAYWVQAVSCSVAMVAMVLMGGMVVREMVCLVVAEAAEAAAEASQVATRKRLGMLRFHRRWSGRSLHRSGSSDSGACSRQVVSTA